MPRENVRFYNNIPEQISLTEYAMMIGVSTRTLQNWVQGRRKPAGPANALLKIAAKNPKAVLEALHS
jgi:putative transcriptional regulator